MPVARQHAVIAAQDLDEQGVAGLGRLLRMRSCLDGGACLKGDAIDLPGGVRGSRAGRDDVVLPDHDRPVLWIRLTSAVGAVDRVHRVLTCLRPTGEWATMSDLQAALPLHGILGAAVVVEI